MKHLILIPFFFLMPLYSFAYSFEQDGIYYNILEDDNLTDDMEYVEVTTNNDTFPSYYKSYIIIPETVSYMGKDYKVKRIGESAFYKCNFLQNIELPTSINSIGDFAFECCYSLKSITLPKGIQAIGDYAFYDCVNLEVVYSLIEVPFETSYYCWGYDDYDENTSPHDIVLCVPYGTRELYLNTKGWDTFFLSTVEYDFYPTTIVQVEMKTDENNTIYNISGIKQEKFTKGINIINGKKYIMR